MNTPLTEAELATNAQTWDHINLVMKLLASAQIELMRRQFTHDRTKLAPPEVSIFVEYTPKLRGLTYGSPEYKEALAAMQPALEHHYAHNRHHPEFFSEPARDEHLHQKTVELDHVDAWFGHYPNVMSPEGMEAVRYALDVMRTTQKHKTSRVNGMNLFDLLEMVLDWYASCQRHANGDIRKSLEINRDRFGISDQLMNILSNTVDWIDDSFSELKTQQDLHPPGLKE